MTGEYVEIGLCSDEQGGEHDRLRIRRADLPKLEALEFFKLYGAGEYGDGAETWQGPFENFEAALALHVDDGRDATRRDEFRGEENE